MPEHSRSPALTDDAISPASVGELAAVVVPDTEAEEVELVRDETGAPAPAIAMGAPSKKRRRWGPFFWFAVAWLAVIIALAVFADVLPFIKDPNETSVTAFRKGPSAEHWLGGDSIGRDILSRIAYGARASLIIGVASIFFGMTVGGSLGLLAGYFRGRSDTMIVGVANILLAFPPLILALALVSFMGRNLSNVILALSILSIPSLIRITRASTMTFAQREFVLAARTLGASHWRVITREVLPNVVPPMASFALLAIAIVIVAEGVLSFLGLSVEAPTPTWGNMISEGQQYLREAAHISLIPCAVMFLTLLSFNYVGDKLREIWNVQEAKL